MNEILYLISYRESIVMGIKAARNTLCYAAGVNHTINYHEQMVVTNQSNQAEHILDHGVSNDLNATASITAPAATPGSQAVNTNFMQLAQHAVVLRGCDGLQDGNNPRKRTKEESPEPDLHHSRKKKFIPAWPELPEFPVEFCIGSEGDNCDPISRAVIYH